MIFAQNSLRGTELNHLCVKVDRPPVRTILKADHIFIQNQIQ